MSLLICHENHMFLENIFILFFLQMNILETTIYILMMIFCHLFRQPCFRRAPFIDLWFSMLLSLVTAITWTIFLEDYLL